MLKKVIDFVTIFALAFVLSALVSWIYSLVIHGNAVIDWETSFRLGIILGLILPWGIGRGVKEGKS